MPDEQSQEQIKPRGMLGSIPLRHRHILIPRDRLTNSIARGIFELLMGMVKPGETHIYPGSSLLGRVLGVSRSTVKRGEKNLIESGLIVISGESKGRYSSKSFMIPADQLSVDEDQVLMYHQMLHKLGQPLVETPEIPSKKKAAAQPQPEIPPDVVDGDHKTPEPSPSETVANPAEIQPIPQTETQTQETPVLDKTATRMDKDKVYAMAVKSAKHMENYLLFGKPALDMMEEGKPQEEIDKLKPGTMNWRKFVAVDVNGNRIIDPETKRPVGYDKFDHPAMTGYFWWTITNYLALRGHPIYTPNWRKLLGIVKNVVNNYGPGATFDRIVQYGQHYDVIMSLVGRAGDLPGEDSLTNALVDRAYRQWCALNEFQKYEVIQKVRN